MDITHLAQIKTLHERTLSAARAETAATFYLLECLHKVDKTRAYLELGYSSLFMYVHKALGYSEGQSYERIEAMRLAFRVKEVGASLRAGTLTMTAVARLSTHSKREKLSQAAVVTLSKELAHKSVREAERVLARAVPDASDRHRPVERIVPISTAHSRLQITIDEECESLLKQARELDANPGVALAEILKRALRMYVADKRHRKYGENKCERKTGTENKSRAKPAAPANSDSNTSSDTSVSVDRSPEYANPHFISVDRSSRCLSARLASGDRSSNCGNSRYITRPVRSNAFAAADHQCEFTSLVTGLRCTETASLQLDHKFPQALGGSSEANNFQVLCAAHNQAKGMQT